MQLREEAPFLEQCCADSLINNDDKIYITWTFGELLFVLVKVPKWETWPRTEPRGVYMHEDKHPATTKCEHDNWSFFFFLFLILSASTTHLWHPPFDIKAYYSQKAREPPPCVFHDSSFKTPRGWILNRNVFHTRAMWKRGVERTSEGRAALKADSRTCECVCVCACVQG